MNQSKISWQKYAAYALGILILIGLSLPWAKWLDLFSRNVGVATTRGWNLIYLVLPALAAVVAAVGAANNAERKWLWWSLILSAASLVSVGYYGIRIFASVDSLLLTKTPLIGFWVTLLAFLGMIGVGGVNLAENIRERQ
jgi:hypothetical protein